MDPPVFNPFPNSPCPTNISLATEDLFCSENLNDAIMYDSSLNFDLRPVAEERILPLSFQPDFIGPPGASSNILVCQTPPSLLAGQRPANQVSSLRQVPEPVARRGTFQINSSRLFLTYPQCDVDKETVFQFLSDKFKPLDLLVAHELHANGDHHIHAFLKLDSPYRTTNARFADLPTGHHGNYQGCRSPKNVVKYCSKNDDFISTFDVSSSLESNNRKRAFGELIAGNISLVDLIKQNPVMVEKYSKLRYEVNSFKAACDDVRKPPPTFLPNPWGLCLFAYRLAKRRHYWFWSSQPNAFKSTMARELAKWFKVYHTSCIEVYWNLVGDEFIVIIDEYNYAQLKYYELNAMADGTYSFRIFQGGLIRLKDPLIIILSNQSLRDIYPFRFDLLEARFICIDVSGLCTASTWKL